MEHPFLVEEFTPAHTTHVASASANRLVTAEPQFSAALPPLQPFRERGTLPNTIRSSICQLLGFGQPPHPAQSGTPRSVQGRACRRCHDRLGALQ